MFFFFFLPKDRNNEGWKPLFNSLSRVLNLDMGGEKVVIQCRFLEDKVVAKNISNNKIWN